MIMSGPVLIAIREESAVSSCSNSSISSSGPRAGGPRLHYSFAPVQKLEFSVGYETACENSEGAAVLRRGLYSSQMSGWRRLDDTGGFAGKTAGESRRIEPGTCFSPRTR